MKKFKVGFYYTVMGDIEIEAKTAKQAEKIVFKELEENGVDEKLKDYDCDDREYEVVTVEKV